MAAIRCRAEASRAAARRVLLRRLLLRRLSRRRLLRLAAAASAAASVVRWWSQRVRVLARRARHDQLMYLSAESKQSREAHDMMNRHTIRTPLDGWDDGEARTGGRTCWRSYCRGRAGSGGREDQAAGMLWCSVGSRAPPVRIGEVDPEAHKRPPHAPGASAHLCCNPRRSTGRWRPKSLVTALPDAHREPRRPGKTARELN